MKLKFLLAGLLSVASTATFAQKWRVNSAKEKYDDYLKLNTNKATYAEADKTLLDAKTLVDQSLTNKTSVAMPLTYAVRAAIYATLSMRDTVKAKTLPLFNTADSALVKAKEMDPNGENKTLIEDAAKNLSQYRLNEGVAEFAAKNYGAAYKDFNYYQTLFPKDSTALFYTGLAAAANNDYANALSSYQKLLPMQFSRNPIVYLSMSDIYLKQKDTVNSLKIASDGVARYPNNPDLRKREIEISLVTGKAEEILGKVEAAIAADPKNKQLYYYAGLTYSSSGSAVRDDLEKAKKDKKDAATIAALQAKKDGFYAKAVDMYKKALEIDPNYFEATLNLGTVLLSPAIDMHNDAGQLPPSKQKEYTALQAKAATQFELAKPYVLKAVELSPNNKDALGNLRNYYVGAGDMAKATETTQKINALK
ncbi:tetratricopeptide repeat protein [Mucilaginibacter panaciglaebae]|uniref:Tetratricopeptide repeat protein n=1 Tax=Mucilaginibacter panaciglaebae TaxID=502331 RepID=A0ABP7WIY9_9SPHI